MGTLNKAFPSIDAADLAMRSQSEIHNRNVQVTCSTYEDTRIKRHYCNSISKTSDHGSARRFTSDPAKNQKQKKLNIT